MNNLKMDKEEELFSQQQGELLAQKTVVLITALFPSQEDQEAMLAIASKLDLDQLEDFIAKLEVKYLELQTKGINDQYEKDLNKIKENYLSRQKEIDDEALKGLADIEKELGI